MNIHEYFARTRVPYPEPLVSTQSRLVAVRPGRWADVIHCEVFKVSDIERQKFDYKALSYAWGHHGRRNPKIIVNDCPLVITANLESALRHLREPEEYAILWVDALCINQDDMWERNSQVSRMRDIYSAAVEVIVFLGDGQIRRSTNYTNRKDPERSIVFGNTSADDHWTGHFLSKWSAQTHPATVTPLDIFCLLSILSRPHDPSRPFQVLERISSTHLVAIFEELRQMLTVRWWDRIWVVQEAILAKNLTVKYGNVSAPWNIFVCASKASSSNLSREHTTTISEDDIKVLSLLSRAVDINNRRKTWAEKSKPNILSLLREFSNRKSSDERDKIYGLLALCDQNTKISPNYSLGIREAYTVATIDILDMDTSLSVLSGDLGRKSRQDLPSWVPDWSATFDEYDRRRISFCNQYAACGESHSIRLAINRFDGPMERDTLDEMKRLARTLETVDDPAEHLPWCIQTSLKEYGAKNPEFQSVCDGLVRFCNKKGRRDVTKFTDVCSICPAPKVLEPAASLYKTVDQSFPGYFGRWFEQDDDLRRWHDCLSMRGNLVGTVAEVLPPIYSFSSISTVSETIETWFQRLFVDKVTNPEKLQLRQVEFVTTILSGMRKTKTGFKKLTYDDKKVMMYWYHRKIENMLPDLIDTELAQPPDEVLHEFTEILQLSITRRSFFITEDGKTGLGPASMAKGDQIFILPGGNMPFVLRHTPTRFLYFNAEDHTFRLIGDCYLHGAMDGQLAFPSIGRLPDEIIMNTLRSLEENWVRCYNDYTLQTNDMFGGDSTWLTSIDREVKWPPVTEEPQELIQEMRTLHEDWMHLSKGWIYLI